MDRESTFDIGLMKEITKKISIYGDLSQRVIITNEDRLENILIKNQKCLISKREWLTPAILLITLMAALSASDFKPFLGFTAEDWKAIFSVSSFICILWLIWCVIVAYRNRNKGTIDYIIKQLKTETEERSQSIGKSEEGSYGGPWDLS